MPVPRTLLTTEFPIHGTTADEWAESKWPSWAGVCLDVPTLIAEQTPFTSLLRGRNLRMKFLYIPQDHS